jgi:hypothetical protein
MEELDENFLFYFFFFLRSKVRMYQNNTKDISTNYYLKILRITSTLVKITVNLLVIVWIYILDCEFKVSLTYFGLCYRMNHSVSTATAYQLWYFVDILTYTCWTCFKSSMQTVNCVPHTV